MGLLERIAHYKEAKDIAASGSFDGSDIRKVAECPRLEFGQQLGMLQQFYRLQTQEVLALRAYDTRVDLLQHRGFGFQQAVAATLPLTKLHSPEPAVAMELSGKATALWSDDRPYQETIMNAL